MSIGKHNMSKLRHALTTLHKVEKVMSDIINDDKKKELSSASLAGDSLGARIVAAREAAGLTQNQLATLLDIPSTQLCRIEKNLNSPRAVMVMRIAAALNVQPGALLDDL